MVLGEIVDAPSSDWDGESDVGEAKNISFDVNALRHAIKDAEDPSKYVRVGIPCNMSFKMIKSDSRLVKSILFSYGFIQCSPKNSNFNLCWSNTHLTAHSLRSLKSWQRCNHFPRSFLITKKDQLHIQLNRARVNYGIGYDFVPESYCTPLNTDKRERLKRMLRPSKNSDGTIFILKPANSSRGRGIEFVNKPEQIDEIGDADNVVISRYIPNPYLIQQKKSDLRIYVAVTSFYPLICYMYTEGLTRFAVDDYTDDTTGISAEAQLTNYSLHKTNEKFVKNERVDCENVGNKWTLGAMLRQMEQSGVDTSLLMIRIEDIVIKTLLSVQRVIGSSTKKLNLNPNTCFELFGFDILVDENLKPWLLEVNLSPSLNCDAPVDSLIKSDLVCSTLNLACIPLVAEKNLANQAYVLSRFSPSVDELSNAVSSTSVASDKVQSASGSPSTVDSGYDSRSVTNEVLQTNNSYRLTSPPRKRVTMKSTKLKRAQLKTSYSPEKAAEQHNARLSALVKKVEDEEQRMGEFIRIFPRPESTAIYEEIFETSGPEQWDKKLGTLLFGNPIEITRRDHEAFQAEIMDASKYTSCDSLNECSKKLLNTAFKTAHKYAMPFYENQVDPFPQALPKLRFGLRKRTLSQIDFDWKRKAEVTAKRECASVDCDLSELKQLLYEQYKSESGTPKLVTSNF